jgi:DNA phosphorothioation-dependent restriction protein DptH
MEISSEKKQINSKILEQKFQLILDTCGQFGIEVSQPEDMEDRFVEGPASILFRLRLKPGIDPRKIYEKAEALKLALALEEEQSISCGQHRGLITLDVPKKPEERYFVIAEDLWNRWKPSVENLDVPIGEDRYGNVVSVNFSSSDSPHLLIGGTTGSGKSVALNSLLLGLINFYSEKELSLRLIDPKEVELANFEDAPQVTGKIGYRAEDAIFLLREAVAESKKLSR